MKKTTIKNLLIVLTIVAALLVVSKSVYATGGIINPFQVNTVQTNTETANANTTTTTNTTTVNTTNTTVNTITNTNQNLPQTGDASDYVIFAFIAVTAVVAIYAYRKVKKYNI